MSTIAAGTNERLGIPPMGKCLDKARYSGFPQLFQGVDSLCFGTTAGPVSRQHCLYGLLVRNRVNILMYEPLPPFWQLLGRMQGNGQGVLVPTERRPRLENRRIGREFVLKPFYLFQFEISEVGSHTRCTICSPRTADFRQRKTLQNVHRLHSGNHRVWHYWAEVTSSLCPQ